MFAKSPVAVLVAANEAALARDLPLRLTQLLEHKHAD
jgi:hypothetical protein